MFSSISILIEMQRADRLAAKLQELNIDPDTI
jgi:hypothetical protein